MCHAVVRREAHPAATSIREYLHNPVSVTSTNPVNIRDSEALSETGASPQNKPADLYGGCFGYGEDVRHQKTQEKRQDVSSSSILHQGGY